MKMKIDKSKVMKRAWSIFRNKYATQYNSSFSSALTRAWELEKKAIRYEAEQRAIMEEEAQVKQWINSDEYKAIVWDNSGAANWYSESPRGTYFGD